MSEDEDTTILLPEPSTEQRQATLRVQQPQDSNADCNGQQSSATMEPPPQKCQQVVLLASAMAAVGGILFGYDVGIISGAVLQLKTELGLTCMQREMVVSIMLVGALLASILGGVMVDQLGRRCSIVLTALVFGMGSLLLCVAPSYPWVLCGRALVGFAASLSAVAECVYISEVAPAASRGALVSLNELAITVGFLLAYLADYALVGVESGWRIMFGLGAVPALLQGIAMLLLPNSPHYLMLRKKEAEAEIVLRKLRGDKSNVKQEMTNIRLALLAEREQNCCTVCSPLDNMQGRLFIGMGLVFFQQVTGQPNVLYYAPEIFKLVGFCGDATSTLASVGLGAIKFVSTCFSVAVIDRVGRRTALLLGTSGMMLSIFLLGTVTTLHDKMGAMSHQESCSDFKLNYTRTYLPDQNGDKGLQMETTTMTFDTKDSFGFFASAPVQPEEVDGNIIGGGRVVTTAFPMLPTPIAETATSRKDCQNGGELSNGFRYLALLSLMAYVACFAFGFGPVTWLILSEIFPTAVKGRAVALATALNWATNLLVSATFLQFVDAVGLGGTFLSYGVICLFACAFIFLAVPETQNKSLSQVSQELRAGSLKSRIETHVSFLPFVRKSRRCCLRVSGTYQHVHVRDPDCSALQSTTVI